MPAPITMKLSTRTTSNCAAMIANAMTTTSAVMPATRLAKKPSRSPRSAVALRILELTVHFPAAVDILTVSGPDRHLAGRARRQGRRLTIPVLHPLLLCRRTLGVSICNVSHVDVLGVDLGHHELAKLGELLDL